MEQSAIGGGSDLMISLMPFIVIWAIFIFAYLGMRKRKGISILTHLIGTFPAWGIFYLIWVASLTDTAVKEKLGLK